MLLLCAPPVVLLGMVSPFAIRLAVSSIATAGAVAGRLYALSTAGSLLGDVPAGARPHPRDRDAADVPRDRRAARRVVVLPARRALPRRRRRCSPRSLVVPPGAIKAEEGLIHEETSFHQYIGVVERPDGRRAAPPERRGRRALGVAARLRAHGRRLGRVPRAAAAPRAAARARGDPRERRRDDRARARRLLPGRARSTASSSTRP